MGTNSIGWCVLELDEENQPFRIETAGVRIFSDGRDPKSNSTLKAERREARSARRRRDRFVQRRQYLIQELIKFGLFPEDETERKSLVSLNPIELRALAIKQKLPLYHIGRALFHLNQRRGFRSNRKDQSEQSSGSVSDSVRLLLEEMELIGSRISTEEYENLSKAEKKLVREKEAQARQQAIGLLNSKKDLTYGSFLWQRQQAGLPTRARPASDGKLYDIYPTRDLYEDEFEKIWDSQDSYHPKILTDELKCHFKKIIYWQRPLKPQILGKCVYFPNEDRTYKAMPSFQRYRIFQEVNNLEWGMVHGMERLIDQDRLDRDFVIDLLQRPSIKKKPSSKNARVTFNKIRKELIKREVMMSYSKFNLESDNRKYLDGNQTSNVMQHEDYVGRDWYSWSLEDQDRFIGIILNDKLSDDKASEILATEFGLSDFAARNCINAPLEDKTASLSLRATRVLAEIMDDEMVIQSDAVIEAANRIPEFINPFVRSRDKQLLPKLPYYGIALQGHIIPGTGRENDEQARIGMISNPTVHIALNEIRRVVNEIIDRFGHPSSIAIELARDLPKGKKERAMLEKEYKRNQDRNQRYNKILHENGQVLNRNNRLRIRLWEEQDKMCVFTGERIGLSELFTDEVEIEHLIPYSQSLDDSRVNKVVCKRRANRFKGNRTPYEAFGQNPDDYHWDQIFSRVQDLPKSQQWRFEPEARQKWEREGDFLARHLNDTRYIARLAREYLENICRFNKIDVVTGRLTAMLRHQWGLNSILDEIQNPTYEIPKDWRIKNRDDHRHHAIDAIVIGMTTRSLIQCVSTAAAQESEIEDSSRLVNASSLVWERFREDVNSTIQKLIVSHSILRKILRQGMTDGQLHNETAYGIVEVSSMNDGPSSVVSRKPIAYFNTVARIQKIRDRSLRDKFLRAFELDRKTGVPNLAKKEKIRRLRCIERIRVIPISSCTGKIYKGFKGDSNWGMEIYEYPEGHPRHGSWDGVVITSFDANQHKFQPGCSHRPHPTSKLVMRLQINDCIEINLNGEKHIVRVQKIRSDQVTLATHNEANVDSRARDENNAFRYLLKSPNTLRVNQSRKVNVSPTGLLTYCRR